MIAVNSEGFYYSCYSNLSPCFFGLGYCRNSNLLMAGTVDNADTVQNSSWCWFWIVTVSVGPNEDPSGESVCIISRGISIIRIKGWRVIIMAVLMVSIKQIAKPTIQEGFIVCLLCCEFRKACEINPLGVEGFWIRLGSEYSNSTGIPYEVVLFP